MFNFNNIFNESEKKSHDHDKKKKNILSFDENENDALKESEHEMIKTIHKKFKKKKNKTKINDHVENTASTNSSPPDFEEDNEEIKRIKERFGIDNTRYKTTVHLKYNDEGEFNDDQEPPKAMTEEEMILFKNVIVPKMSSFQHENDDSNISSSSNESDENTDDDGHSFDTKIQNSDDSDSDDSQKEEEYDQEQKQLKKMISKFQPKINKKQTNKHIHQLIMDERFLNKKESKKVKIHDTYKDLKYFESMRLFSIEWKSTLLNDQTVEIPFIYLQSLETGGLGAISYHFYGAIQMLEAYGMTVETISESTSSCYYRAFFSGKIVSKNKNDDIESLKEMIRQREQKTRQNYTDDGGSSAQSIHNMPEDSYQSHKYVNSELHGIDRMKVEQFFSTYHERPVKLFETKKMISEELKKKKKKENVLKMKDNLNKDLQNSDDDEISSSDDDLNELFLDEDEQNEDDEIKNAKEEKKRLQQYHDEYEYLLNGFTKNMIQSLNTASKSLNKKSIDSMPRKNTEISAWIEKHLCFDICVFPGLNGEKDHHDDAKIERQLLFTFNLVNQNPYTFLLMNLTKDEKEKKLLIQ